MADTTVTSTTVPSPDRFTVNNIKVLYTTVQSLTSGTKCEAL